ncbi:hypothetical protein CTI12_AA238780 [Artemisia annua]|uniref:Uncharacterized protein n=1 Tax=Artemisia annua TaxID=35608 RepID=A0A2U1NPH1_ARTAN|nr:hypothetical protein CTI12_AA238780 [Artemisia annua]
MRCLDCGNKAKKDCLYYRCRSCCKGHGFQCQTHIKSTWVPISTRQSVRNLAANSAAPPHNDHHQQEEQQQLSIPSSSGFGGPFPTEVSGEATFTCVRVTTNLEQNAPVDQYAYETSINIGGHLFKGLLYDQGPHRPVVNSRDMDANAGDPHNSTININQDFQAISSRRSSGPLP